MSSNYLIRGYFKPLLFPSVLASTLLFSGCKDKNSSSEGPTTITDTTGKTENTENIKTITTGTLIDNVLSGIKYVNDTAEGYTNSNGEFPYIGGVIEFYVGNIKIGELNSLPSDNKIFVQDLVGVSRTDTNDSRVQQIGSFLQSLDSNSFTEKIELQQADFDKFTTINDDIANLDVNTILPNAGFSKVRSNANAKRHMDNVLKYYGIINDSTKPTVVSSTPNNSSNNIALNSKIEVKFSEDMPREQMTSSNVVLKDSNNNIISTSLNFEWDTITITPNSSLLADETYTLSLDASLKDFSNNSLQNDVNISFDTVISDTTPPIITSSKPLNNDVNVEISDKLTITFSESLDSTSVNSTNIVLRKKSDNSIIASNLSYDNSNKRITIKPDVNLSDDSFYFITIGTGITDTSSNALSSTQIINFMVGDDISYKGYSYKVLKSPITDKNWLDRNLGAYKVCTKSRDDSTSSYANDTAYINDQKDCFGDYYQWGRLADGHQEAINDAVNIPNKTASTTSSNRAKSYIDVEHSNFIKNSKSPNEWLENNTQDSNNIDDKGTLRSKQWSKTDGTSICPIGFRVPTSTELYAETTEYSGIDNEITGAVDVTNRDTAFKNFLKLPVSGYRDSFSGYLIDRGNEGSIWSSSIGGEYSRYLYFYSSIAGKSRGDRAYSFSVRCIKD